MLKKLANILFSTRLTAILFITFAAAMATGTFLDAGQETSPTPYTRNLIYNTLWFELIMVFFVINFVGNIFRYQLYQLKKWATLTLHLAFIFILLGAYITRYHGFEGMMSIREGATENTFLTQKTYIETIVSGDYTVNNQLQQRRLTREVDFSPRLNNKFEIKTDYNEQPITIELEKFIANAEEDIIPDDSGEEYLKIVESAGGLPHNHFLKNRQVSSLHNVLISLNKPTNGAINITTTNNGLTIQSPFKGEYLQMATGNTGELVIDSIQPLMLRSRYVIGNMQMVFPKPVVKGKFDLVKKPQILKGGEDGIVLKVITNGQTERVKLLGGQGVNNEYKRVKIGDLDFMFKYGSLLRELPFSIKLNDFVADKRPGTEKVYSAFSSEVTVLDEQEAYYDYKIYMNNILDHSGYRFFQSGFDPDEKGTILSVNHDFWGTWITYLGYFLLYFGLLAILFAKHTRFDDLRKQLKKVKAKKAELLTVLFFCFAVTGFSQEHSQKNDHSRVTKAQIDSILTANIVPVKHAAKFAKMVIQDANGRMKPVNTYASELLRKLSKKEDYENLDPNQVFISMHENQRLWYNVPIIYLTPKKGDSIRKIIGLDKSEKYATLAHFFTDRGVYILGPFLDNITNINKLNAFENQFQEVNQRVNLLYNTLDGRSLKIFPIPEDENNKWISSTEFRVDGYRTKIKDSLYGNFINSGLTAYFYTLNNAKASRDFSKAEELLESFKKTQQKFGSEVMLSDSKIEAEIAYINTNIFKKLSYYYLLAGFLMFLFLIIQIFYYKSKFISIMVAIFKWSIVVLFLIHIIGLLSRWYISGHAPWTDTYETMLYVAWSTVFFGFILGRKSGLTIASVAFVASIILMFAHKNWLDPSITDLQPVLDSYWILIHVSIIVASYGPFTLGMILGVVSLLLMIFTTSKNRDRMSLNIKELTIINEMALTVGLVMLAIGNFLGGMWANESWGRYWGWDPKETWALISIMIYAFVIHMRLVPGLRGRWFFNLMSIVAFASIMMTYFGVNFYLAGLHSYASGDQIISFKFIAIICALVAILAFFAYRSYVKFYKK